MPNPKLARPLRPGKPDLGPRPAAHSAPNGVTGPAGPRQRAANPEWPDGRLFPRCPSDIVGKFPMESARDPAADSVDQPLHVDHIQPAVEFETNLAEVSDLLEAKPRVKPDAGHVVAVDHRDDRVQAQRTGRVNQR